MWNSSDDSAHVFTTAGPARTRHLAERLAGLLRGDEVIHLAGGLGAGKTCFVKGLARGLGVAENQVTSPSFTLINEYRGRTSLFHVDLYRIEDPREVSALGLEEYFKRGVMAVEWPERLPPHLREHDVEVTFRPRSTLVRDILVTGPDGAPSPLAERLARLLRS